MKINDMWMSYKAIMPITASDVQVREIKRAFYAGINLYAIEISSLDDAVTEEELEEKVCGWHEELSSFFNDVVDGVQ